MHTFITILKKRSRLGWRNGRVWAPSWWWKAETKDMSEEIQNLVNDPPLYLKLLQTIFEDRAVDLSTSFVPDQAEINVEDADACNELPHDNSARSSDNACFELPHDNSARSSGNACYELPHDNSARSSGSCKRSSGSWNTTGVSPGSERSKGDDNNNIAQIVQIARAVTQMAQEKQKIKEQINQLSITVRELAWKSGVMRGSPEHIGVISMCQNVVDMEEFLLCETPAQRVAFIENYMAAKQNKQLR